MTKEEEVRREIIKAGLEVFCAGDTDGYVNDDDGYAIPEKVEFVESHMHAIMAVQDNVEELILRGWNAIFP
jgi:hypothetical protein